MDCPSRYCLVKKSRVRSKPKHKIYEELINAICEDTDITLYEHAIKRKIKGIAINYGGDKSIAYSSELNGWGKVSVIAHEIGYHLLGHLEEKILRPLEHTEQEARVFSAAFTAVAVFHSTYIGAKNSWHINPFCSERAIVHLGNYRTHPRFIGYIPIINEENCYCCPQNLCPLYTRFGSEQDSYHSDTRKNTRYSRC